jgi:hypothetical protein
LLSTSKGKTATQATEKYLKHGALSIKIIPLAPTNRLAPAPVYGHCPARHKVLSNAHFRPYSTVYIGLVPGFDAGDNVDTDVVYTHGLDKTTVAIA